MLFSVIVIDTNAVTENAVAAATTISEEHDEGNIGGTPKLSVSAEHDESRGKVVATLALEEGSHLGVADVAVRFDPTALTLSSYEKGFEPDYFIFNDNDAENGTLMIYIISLTDIVSAQTLATLEFDVTYSCEERDALIDVECGRLTSSLAEEITLDIIDGSVTLPSKHVYSSECDAFCNLCGDQRDADAEHTFTDGEDVSCDDCEHERAVESIEILTKPDKLVYLEGKDALEVGGGEIKLIYDDGTVGTVAMSEDMVSGFDNTISGEQELTVTYGDFEATFKVEIAEKTLVGIEITVMPAKTEYLEGKDELDLSGGILTLYYDNGTSREISLSEAVVSGFDNTVLGEDTLTVEYGGMTADFCVQIFEKSLTHIEITAVPEKTAFLEGKDELDVTGGQITLYYDNGTSMVLDMLLTMVSGFDNTVSGVQTLTVTCDGKDATYDIEITAKTLLSIELINNGLKMEYLEGKDVLDVSGGTVRLLYDNDTYSDTALTEEMVSGFDNSIVGAQELTVTYEQQVVTFEIEIIAKSPKSIAVTTLPTKTHYLSGVDAFDANGGKITIYYNNDTEEELDLIAEWVSGFSNEVVGSYTLTVAYGGFSDTFKVTVDDKTLVAIEITKLPDKLIYLEGDKFDGTGIVVAAHFDNDTVEVISDYVIGGYEKTPGEKTVTVTYSGFTDTFTVEVKEKSPVSIEVTKAPDKLTYLEGEELDLTGLAVTLYYDNGTFEEITDYTVDGYDTAPGEKTITVSYGDFTVAFTVEVKEKSPVSIEVTKAPDKLTYLEGDELDLTGMTVILLYDNGTFIEISEYTVDGYDTAPGEKTITVSYGDFTAAFTVEVKEKSPVSIEITKAPDKLIYLEGEELDLTGMTVTVYYDNGTFEELTDYTVDGYDAVPGEKTIIVSYGELADAFAVTVNEKSPTSIEITAKPDKLTYVEGEEFDVIGMVITLCYDNGTSEEITDYTVEGYDSAIGEKTITVTYGDFTDTFTVEVVQRAPVSIEVTVKPDKLIYIEGEELDLTGMAVALCYNDGSLEEISDYTVDGYDFAVGEKTITVSYGDFTDTFTVTVKSRVPSDVTSEKHTVGASTISKITAGTTVSELLSAINEGEYCKVYKGSVEVSADTAVGTGMTVCIMDGNEAKASYTVIVTGDTNGDGAISVTDMIAIKAHVLKKTMLSGVYATAADSNGDGGISITDFIQVKTKILGKGDVTAR